MGLCGAPYEDSVGWDAANDSRENTEFRAKTDGFIAKNEYEWNKGTHCFGGGCSNVGNPSKLAVKDDTKVLGKVTPCNPMRIYHYFRWFKFTFFEEKYGLRFGFINHYPPHVVPFEERRDVPINVKGAEIFLGRWM